MVEPKYKVGDIVKTLQGHTRVVSENHMRKRGQVLYMLSGMMFPYKESELTLQSNVGKRKSQKEKVDFSSWTPRKKNAPEVPVRKFTPTPAPIPSPIPTLAKPVEAKEKYIYRPGFCTNCGFMCKEMGFPYGVLIANVTCNKCGITGKLMYGSFLE